jgi:peptidylprolyl isomerase
MFLEQGGLFGAPNAGTGVGEAVHEHPTAAVFAARAVTLQRSLVRRTRVALVRFEAVRREVFGHLAHLAITADLGKNAGCRHRQAVGVGLHHHLCVRNDAGKKVPLAVDNGGVDRHSQPFHGPPGGEALRLRHTQVVAFLSAGGTDGPCLTPAGHAIEQLLALGFGQHLRITNTVDPLAPRQQRRADHERSGPRTTTNFVNTDHVLMTRRPQLLLGMARWRHFLGRCLRPNHTRTVACISMTKPTVTIPDELAPAELVIVDDVVGDGATAASGQNVMVHYVGVSWSTGEQFDASWDRMEPFEFRLGAGQVITGWDKGVAGMKIGGRRTLTIPPHLGYGARGAGGVIKPNETLVFVVDLLAVR